MHTILLVDDEPDVLDFLSYTIGNEGYRVFTANNGQEAIEKTIEVSPTLIIMDVMMPVMDGIETMKEIMMMVETGLFERGQFKVFLASA